MRTVLSVFLLTLSNMPALAEPKALTGAILAQLCESSKKEEADFCVVWTTGFVEGVFAAQALEKELQTCLPEDLQKEAARKAILDHITKYPNTAGYTASAAAYLGLAEAYPCKTGQ